MVWDQAGGDYHDSTACITTYAEECSWEAYDVTAIVHRWIGGAQNSGFLVVADLKDGNTGREYASSEFAEDSLRPKLTLICETSGIHSGNNTAKSRGVILWKAHGTGVMLFVPFTNPYRIAVFDGAGRGVTELTGHGAAWRVLPAASSSNGVYFIRIVSGGSELTGRCVIIR